MFFQNSKPTSSAPTNTNTNTTTPSPLPPDIIYRTPPQMLTKGPLTPPPTPPSPTLLSTRHVSARAALHISRTYPSPTLALELFDDLATQPITRPPLITKLPDPEPTPTYNESSILNFLPIQIPFPAHPSTPYPISYFSTHFAELFKEVLRWVDTNLAYSSLPPSSTSSPPSILTPQLLSYLSHTTSTSPTNWSPLLQDTKTRKWLLVSVLVRILEMQVLNRDLFGVDERGKEVLEALDRGFVGGDVYTQHHLRTRTIRCLLGSSPVTPEFHSLTTHLTARVLLMLYPLFNYLSSSTTNPPSSSPSSKPPPSLPSTHQSLHNLISRCAHLSLCTRLSPYIFQYQTLYPGTEGGWEPGEVEWGRLWSGVKRVPVESMEIAIWPCIRAYALSKGEEMGGREREEEEEEEEEETVYTLTPARGVRCNYWSHPNSHA
ncbi:hypothetical protein CJF30_00001431 [Rutstroemia sp. NJR-2017a BBW]|nr:hypothetical protein CJF30_00001431 [Rutstroemia sp. NJR-2017a BBW]